MKPLNIWEDAKQEDVDDYYDFHLKNDQFDEFMKMPEEAYLKEQKLNVNEFISDTLKWRDKSRATFYSTEMKTEEAKIFKTVF